MLRRSSTLLKKGWTHTPGRGRRGGKNLAWRSKMPEKQQVQANILNNEFPRKRPNVWQDAEFRRLGLMEWPKEVGFYNSGDNFELTPEMMFKLYQKNKSEVFWTQQHNEKTIIHLMPLVEADKQNMALVDDVFREHIARFGADSTIYNAVMQAAAFAKDLDRCLSLFKEMKASALDPNAQTYVNMMLAVRLSGGPKEKAEVFFNEAVKVGALSPVMRLDTEMQMWWDQLERMGSFGGEEGFLAAGKDEGATPRPKDVYALWGWDKDERKFQPKEHIIREQAVLRSRPNGQLYGTVYSRYRRQPWAKYRGVFPWDIRGPGVAKEAFFPDAPAHTPLQ